MAITYVIEGMSCGHCLTAVTEALKQLDPRVSVTLDPPRAVFPGDTGPDRTAVAAALERAGGYRLAG